MTATLEWNPAALELLSLHPGVELHCHEVGMEMAGRAQRLAGEGPGARSITAVSGRDERSAYARVSWQKWAFWMHFQEFGTSRMPPHPFLRPAFTSI